ncbi:MAG: MFS transporter [Acidobacteriota bacterium]
MPPTTPDNASATAPARGDRASLAVVYGAVFLDFLGFGILLPFLPYFARTLNASGFDLGLLFTAYAAAQMLGAAVLGRVSDRIGRRPILLLSLFGATTGMVLTGLANTLVMLIAARGFAGLFGGSIVTAQAYIADVTPAAQRARAMGFLGASIGAGFTIGPALGAGLGAAGGTFTAAAFCAAGLGALNLIFAFVRLREPAQRQRHSDTGLAANLRDALRDGALLRVLVATFCTAFAFIGFETALAFFLQDRYGFGSAQFGGVLGVLGLLLILVQGGLIGPTVRRLRVVPVASGGAALLGLGLVGLPLGGGLIGAFLALALVAIGRGFSQPTLITLVSLTAPAARQGAFLGVAQSVSAAARATSPLLAGLLYDLREGAPFWIGGVFALLAALVIASLPRDAATDRRASDAPPAADAPA